MLVCLHLSFEWRFWGALQGAMREEMLCSFSVLVIVEFSVVVSCAVNYYYLSGLSDI